ncbi:MAG: hypothetical protein GEV10_15205 [Streptosporangiales bacterium]|nr:hypothetical protein [Streptosporangiales bacterium]
MSDDPRVPALAERLQAAAARVTELRDRLDRSKADGADVRALGAVGLALTAASLVLPWGRASEPREDVLELGLADVERYASLSPTGVAIMVGLLAVTCAALATADRWTYGWHAYAAGVGLTVLVGVGASTQLTPGGATVGTYVAVVGLLLAFVPVAAGADDTRGRRPSRSVGSHRSSA